MVIHFIKRFRQIKRTETDSEATRNISINNRSYGLYSVGTANPFLKPNWLSLVVKKVAYRSSKQCSNIFGSTGLIDIPRKSSTVRHFPMAWPPFGKETV